MTTDFGYSVDRFGNPVAQGWPRVRLALEDRVPPDLKASVIADEWARSRFTATEALTYIVEHDCLRPVDVEAL